jgi:catechol 2,3-dioxygenase-like lactoylglutathione lyase family enzyme
MARLDVVGVIESDLHKAIEFYQRLGLQFPVDPDPMGHGHVEASLPGELRFTLDTEESIDAFWGQRYAQVKDPDGSVLDLFAPLD